ncbi:MAG: GAF domain-containing protein [Candidatus Xenobiia bacterium LiM19]
MKKILVIAEKEMAGPHIKAGVGVAGFEMHVMCSAEDAIGRLKEISPVLCIIDRSVSGNDGSELFKKIRSQSEIPVLALSDGDSQYAAKILNEGADDCLAKTFSPDELAARIHAVLGRWRKSRVYGRISMAYEMCRSLSAFTLFGTALDAVFSMLEMLFEFQSCAIFVIENGMLTPVKYTSPYAESLEMQSLLQIGEEVINQALRELRPVLITDSPTDSVVKLFKDERSMMCVPLACDLGLFGAIYVGAKEAGVYDEMDLEVLSAIGCLARLALEGAKCNETARQYFQSANSRIDNLCKVIRQITALDELTRALISCPSEDAILDTVGAKIKNLLNYRSFIVFMIRRNDGEMEIVPGFVDSPDRALFEDAIIKVTDNVMGWVIAQRKNLFLEDTKDSRLPNLLENERSAVICPIVVENEVLGVVYTGSEEPFFFDEDMIEKVSSISSRIAAALANVRS